MNWEDALLKTAGMEIKKEAKKEPVSDEVRRYCAIRVSLDKINFLMQELKKNEKTKAELISDEELRQIIIRTALDNYTILMQGLAKSKM